MEVKTLDKELEDFIYSLEKQTIAKVIKTVGLLEKFGNLLTLPHSKKHCTCVTAIHYIPACCITFNVNINTPIYYKR